MVCEKNKEKNNGFAFIKVLGIIAILGVIVFIFFIPSFLSSSGMAERERDAKRKIDITQIGKLISSSCYMPDAGPGKYDIEALIPELSAKYPQYAQYLTLAPRDPAGTETESKYMYVVDANGKCAVFANLEDESEPITLPGLSQPTPGGGIGILQSASIGWNGTSKYFQISN